MKADIKKRIAIHLHLSEEELRTLYDLVRMGFATSPGPTEEERDMSQWLEQLVKDL